MINADQDDFMRSLPDPRKIKQTNVERQREYHLLRRIEEIEGKVMTQEEVRKFGGVHRNPHAPEETITWKGRPILYYWIDVEQDTIKVKDL